MQSEIEGKGQCREEKEGQIQQHKLKIISEGSENWLQRMECQSAGDSKEE